MDRQPPAFLEKSLDKLGDLEYNTFCSRETGTIWVWRSLVACLNGVQEAGGSNPLTQTLDQMKHLIHFSFWGS